MSDLALELTEDSKKQADAAARLPAVAEQVEDAQCECCGMLEECTRECVRRVRERYCGRWVCGLCTPAVSGKADRNDGGRTEEALAAHMGVCGRFNRVGRANPVPMQTEPMREILRKRSRSNSLGPMAAPSPGAPAASPPLPFTKDLNCINK